MTTRDRFSQYDFVITILWVGFILAISFMETPLRFQAESITKVIALQVGRLVFHALNGCEIAFALAILVCQLLNTPSKNSRRLFFLTVLVLVVQTVLLFAVLDGRTNAIIENREVQGAPYHMVYIGLEVVKLFSLILLACSQLKDFRLHLTGS